MTTYLVERYLPGRDRAWLEEALARIPRDDADVSYLGSLYVPSDESCFCRFTAPDAESVRRLNELAGVPFARVVAVIELVAKPKENNYALPRIDRCPGRGRKHRSGLGPNADPEGARRKEAGRLELTYTKWFAPGFPNMVGVVGGDIVGKFGGAVYEKTGPDANGLVHLTAIYIVIAPDPAQSFTAHVEGIEDLNTQTAVLDGRVVDGWLRHAHVHAEFNIDQPCAQAPSGTCFQGTISVRRRSNA